MLKNLCGLLFTSVLWCTFKGLNLFHVKKRMCKVRVWRKRDGAQQIPDLASPLISCSSSSISASSFPQNHPQPIEPSKTFPTKVFGACGSCYVGKPLVPLCGCAIHWIYCLGQVLWPLLNLFFNCKIEVTRIYLFIWDCLIENTLPDCVLFASESLWSCPCSYLLAGGTVNKYVTGWG